MAKFTPQSRDHVRERLLAAARDDARITGGAITGSIANETDDGLSDIDLAFGIAAGIDPESVLRDWTELLTAKLHAVHHFDLRAGSAIYRVFLLADGLEVDIGLWPASEFGAAGPKFRLVFGESVQRPQVTPPSSDHLIGLCWHHALHAHAAIERAKPWEAEFYISALRDHLLALACIRFGLPAVYARGIDDMPTEMTAPYEPTLVRSLEPAELRRTLIAATQAFQRELEATRPELAAGLGPVMESSGIFAG